MSANDTAELVDAKDRAAWRRWLQRNHARSSPVWLVLAKKGASVSSVSYEEAVEEALCFGWIDSKANALDGGGSSCGWRLASCVADGPR
jgi:uncharacterized protein YdeI (YjbR/CyaY-like superfamily)